MRSGDGCLDAFEAVPALKAPDALRGARHATLVPPGCGATPERWIACYASHLSHKDRTLVKADQEVVGEVEEENHHE